MNYNLAKQLKDAGFPQENVNMKNYHPTHGIAFGIPHPDTLIDLEVVAMPNLSELIEACGGKLFRLSNGGWDGEYKISRWRDWTARNEALEGQTVLDYPTPEEAVANLWLALNKK